MCCLFTCCGWMIDLIQRLWTFTMSCCISSAVCCSLVTASMSGIALGYNYSLAEYIDLKETNVSVYLKRGVFDDEIGDDMDWRRSGHQPVAGHIGENNLRTGAPEEEASSIRSGRRLDDSIYESDDRNKFEGSLMRLTAKAPAPSPTTQSETNTEVDMDQVLSKHRMGSVDQMKAIQTLINMRKSADSRRKTASGEVKTKEFYLDERYLPHVPIHPGSIGPGRRLMPSNGPGVHSTPGNSARLAVPDESINEEAKWLRPKLPPEAFTRDSFGNYDVRATYPMPVTPRAGPVRPTRPKPVYRPRPTLTTSPSTSLLGQQELGYPKSIDEDMDAFKNKLLLDKYESPSFKDEDFVKDIKGPRRNYEDYEEAAKGVPIRRKRNSLIFFKTLKGKTLKTSDDANNKSDTTGLHILVKSRELSKKAENENNDSENGPPLTVYENIKSTTSPNTVTASSSILIKLLQTTVS